MKLALGIGCRRGTSEEEIGEAVMSLLREQEMTLADIDCLASCDIKADEPGLLSFASKNSIRIAFYKASELAEVKTPTPSKKVEAVTGSPSVSEAAAILASNGTIVMAKKIYGNITLSLAEGRTADE